MRPTRTGALIALATAGILLLSGCTGSSSPDDTSSSTGGTLTLSVPVPTSTFDPAGSDWGAQAPIYQAVYDTLLLATPEGTIEPWLATDWSYNDDGTELTLTLRDDVTFIDGSALTAEVVVENLTRYRDGSGPNASYLAGVTDLAAPDEHTVVITLDAPNPALLNYLSRDAGLVASGEALGDESLATDPVGSGPYILDTAATVTGSTYTFTKNPDYWNPDVQYYDELVIKALFEDSAVVNAIKAGELNGAPLSSSVTIAEVESAGWTITSNEVNWSGLVLFDRAGEMNPALGDVRVRQAINYALDREGLMDAIEAGYGSVTTQVFPETSVAYDAELDEHYAYDPDKARELLAEAGYADGLTIALPSTTIFGATVFPLLQQQLADVGITAEYTDPGPQNLLSDVLAPKFPAAWFALDQAASDWQLANFMIAPTAPWNALHYQDAQVDEYLEAMQYGSEDEQTEAVRALNQYLVDQAWFAPAYRLQNNFATDENTTVEMMPGNKYPSLYDIKPVQ